MHRHLAILLALVLPMGILGEASFWVIPELIEAVKLIAEIAVTALDRLAQLEESTDLSRMSLGVPTASAAYYLLREATNSREINKKITSDN